MKISVRNLEPTKVKLTVTVDPEEFNPYLDNARKEIAKQVNVPGFRKGHVPGKIIDQRIGFGAVAGEAVNNGVPELYSKALEEKGIRPMAQPEIDVQEVPDSAKDETNGCDFYATFRSEADVNSTAGQMGALTFGGVAGDFGTAEATVNLSSNVKDYVVAFMAGLNSGTVAIDNVNIVEVE